MSAITDSEAIVRFDEENKPGVSNLISILSATTDESINEELKDTISAIMPKPPHIEITRCF